MTGLNPNDIVITGLGMATSVGDTTEECWENIKAGVPGIRHATVIPALKEEPFYVAETNLPLVDNQPGLDPKTRPTRVDRCHQIAWNVVDQALRDSKLFETGSYSRDRIGVVVGTLLGGQRAGERFHRQWLKDGLANADGVPLLRFTLASVSDSIAEKYDLRGPRCVQSNACAAGAVAIAYAVELIWAGQADAVLSGGVDPIALLALGGFSSLDAIDPKPCGPYTRSDGISIGEGAAFLILERRESAEARDAQILATVAGYGLTLDAYHPTAPDPRGQGAVGSMTAALQMAGLETSDVDYINGHGTGTPANDVSESAAILQLFGECAPPTSSTKSMIGHTLGAAGAIEAGVCALAIRDQVMPPTFVPEGESNTTKLDIIPGTARDGKVDVVLSNSFAFGGSNASLVLTEPDKPLSTAAATTDRREVVITAVGALAGTANGVEEVMAALSSGTKLYEGQQADLEDFGKFPISDIPESSYKGKINPKYYRKMDDLARSTAVAAKELLNQRKLSRSESTTVGVLSATTGPLETIKELEHSIITKGVGDAKVFPNSVMNGAAGYVALLNSLHGPTATIVGGGPASVNALFFASQLIASGSCDRIIVVSGDEAPEIHALGHAWLGEGYLSRKDCIPGQNSGRVFGAASVAVLLEAAECADQSKVMGAIRGIGLSGGSGGCGRVHAEPWAKAMKSALDGAGAKPEDLSLFVSDACGLPGIDDAEAAAIAELGLVDVPSFAPKAYVGDTQSSAPMIGLLYGLFQGAGEKFLVSSMDVGERYGALVVENK